MVVAHRLVIDIVIGRALYLAVLSVLIPCNITAGNNGPYWQPGATETVNIML